MLFLQVVFVFGDWFGLLLWQFDLYYLVDVDVLEVLMVQLLKQFEGVLLQYVLEVCNVKVYGLVLVVVVCCYGVVLVIEDSDEVLLYGDVSVGFVYVWIKCSQVCLNEGLFVFVQQCWVECV